MKSLTIATELVSNETNVEVHSMEEFNKFEKFVGECNLFVWINGLGWMTSVELKQSGNNIEDLFN